MSSPIDRERESLPLAEKAVYVLSTGGSFVRSCHVSRTEDVYRRGRSPPFLSRGGDFLSSSLSRSVYARRGQMALDGKLG